MNATPETRRVILDRPESSEERILELTVQLREVAKRVMGMIDNNFTNPNINSLGETAYKRAIVTVLRQKGAAAVLALIDQKEMLARRTESGDGLTKKINQQALTDAAVATVRKLLERLKIVTLDDKGLYKVDRAALRLEPDVEKIKVFVRGELTANNFMGERGQPRQSEDSGDQTPGASPSPGKKSRKILYGLANIDNPDELFRKLPHLESYLKKIFTHFLKQSKLYGDRFIKKQLSVQTEILDKCGGVKWLSAEDTVDLMLKMGVFVESGARLMFSENTEVLLQQMAAGDRQTEVARCLLELRDAQKSKLNKDKA